MALDLSTLQFTPSSFAIYAGQGSRSFTLRTEAHDPVRDPTETQFFNTQIGLVLTDVSGLPSNITASLTGPNNAIVTFTVTSPFPTDLVGTSYPFTITTEEYDDGNGPTTLQETGSIEVYNPIDAYSNIIGSYSLASTDSVLLTATFDYYLSGITKPTTCNFNINNVGGSLSGSPAIVSDTGQIITFTQEWLPPRSAKSSFINAEFNINGATYWFTTPVTITDPGTYTVDITPSMSTTSVGAVVNFTPTISENFCKLGAASTPIDIAIQKDGQPYGFLVLSNNAEHSTVYNFYRTGTGFEMFWYPTEIGTYTITAYPSLNWDVNETVVITVVEKPTISLVFNEPNTYTAYDTTKLVTISSDVGNVALGVNVGGFTDYFDLLDLADVPVADLNDIPSGNYKLQFKSFAPNLANGTYIVTLTNLVDATVSTSQSFNVNVPISNLIYFDSNTLWASTTRSTTPLLFKVRWDSTLNASLNVPGDLTITLSPNTPADIISDISVSADATSEYIVFKFNTITGLAPTGIPLGTYQITVALTADPTTYATHSLSVTSGTGNQGYYVIPNLMKVPVLSSNNFTVSTDSLGNDLVTTVDVYLNGLAASGQTEYGSVTSNGNGTFTYNAPATVPVNDVVELKVVSKANPTVFGIAEVTIIPKVELYFSSGSKTASANLQQEVTIYAKVTGAANPENVTVVWKAQSGADRCVLANTYSSGDIKVGTAKITNASLTTLTIFAEYNNIGSFVINNTPATQNLVLNLVTGIVVTPNTATLNLGATQQFTSSIDSSGNNNTNWNIFRLGQLYGSGDSTVGTITSNGLYTAPATGLTPEFVNIEASSKVNPNIRASALVTLLGAGGLNISTASLATGLVGATYTQYIEAVNGTNYTWSIAADSPTPASALALYGLIFTSENVGGINKGKLTTNSGLLLQKTTSPITIRFKVLSNGIAATKDLSLTIQDTSSGPTLTSIAPSSVSNTITNITLTGSGFINGDTVYIKNIAGNISAPAYACSTVYVGATTLTFTVPSQAEAGQYEISVVRNGITTYGYPAVLLNYSSTSGNVTISGISPSSVAVTELPKAGVVITGNNFAGTVVVEVVNKSTQIKTTINPTSVASSGQSITLTLPNTLPVGSYSVYVKNNVGDPQSNSVDLAITGATTTLTLSPASLPSATYSSSFSQAFSLTATNGSGTYAWSLQNSAGFVLSGNSGTNNTVTRDLTGIPSGTTVQFTLVITDAAKAATITKTYSFVVTTNFEINNPEVLPSVNYGENYNGSGYQFTTVNAVGAVSWSLLSRNTLPLAATLSSSGLLTWSAVSTTATIYPQTVSFSVKATDAGNGKTASKTFRITVLPRAISISSITPNSVKTDISDEEATIYGSGFMTGASVQFGSLGGISPIVVDSGTIRVKIPASSQEGIVGITVSNPDGGSYTKQNLFSYIKNTGPIITSMTPRSGTPNGGTTVTITGSNFGSNPKVLFDNIEQAIISATPNVIKFVTSAANAGSVDVKVVNESGAVIKADYFTYRVGPRIISVVPSICPSTGGISVYITGTGFYSETVVDPATGLEQLINPRVFIGDKEIPANLITLVNID